MFNGKQSAAWLFVALFGFGLIGCGTAGGGASMDDMATAVRAQKAAQERERQLAGEQDAQAGDQPHDGSPGSVPDEDSRRLAGRPGVEEGGYFSAMVGARRHVLNRVDRLAWLQGVQHFQAEEGRLPKDHEEFMSRVVERHGIDLGYKEENQEFLYDPSEGDWGEVFVVELVEEPAQP